MPKINFYDKNKNNIGLETVQEINIFPQSKYPLIFLEQYLISLRVTVSANSLI